MASCLIGIRLLRFNPRPRREGDFSLVRSVPCWPVSIHALAGRATDNIKIFSSNKTVSIHALAGRATSDPKRNPSGQACFNPRPRREGDLQPHRFSILQDVSIHALAGRATQRPQKRVFILTFQSTPSQGGRRGLRPEVVTVFMFQSTPSQGGRPGRWFKRQRLTMFQSTPSQGGRRSRKR